MSAGVCLLPTPLASVLRRPGSALTLRLSRSRLVVLVPRVCYRPAAFAFAACFFPVSILCRQPFPAQRLSITYLYSLFFLFFFFFFFFFLLFFLRNKPLSQNLVSWCDWLRTPISLSLTIYT